MRLTLFIFFILTVCAYPFITYGNKEVHHVIVEEKTVKRTEESDKYLIFTDKGVFENTDMLFLGKFNSSDFYAGLKVGESYLITTRGYRVPFLSMYPNIVNYERQDQTSKEN